MTTLPNVVPESDHYCRGYDAVQFMSALAWRDSIGQAVVPATFDRQLTNAWATAGLRVWPA